MDQFFVTAFRVFGDFHWPPDPKKLGADTHPGIVEIHFVRVPPGPDLVGVIRWLPRAMVSDDFVSKEFVPDIAGTDHLASLSDRQLLALFKNADREIVLRLDAPSSGKIYSNVRLQFRGARVFDQFKLEEKSNVAGGNPDPTPEVRWVLARQYEREGESYFSEVLFGQPDNNGHHNPSFRLNIAIPTPAAQTQAIDTAGRFDRAFSISALYQPHTAAPPATGATSLAFHTLVVGRSHQVQWPSSLSPRLGCFNFADADGTADNHLGVPSDFWPKEPRAFTRTVLRRLGYDSSLPNNVLGRTATGANFFSIRFKKNAAGRGTRIVFRQSVAVNKSGIHHRDGDVRYEPGGHHLLLAMPRQAGQFIDIDAPHLIVELEHSYPLERKDIWTLIDKDSEAEVREEWTDHIKIRMGWCNAFDPQVVKGPLHHAASTWRSIPEMFGDVVKGMRLVRLGLAHGEPEAPRSMLPDLDFSAHQRVQFALLGRTDAAFGKNGRIRWGMEDPERTDHFIRPDLHLTLWPESHRLEGDGEANLVGQGFLPSFVSSKDGAARVAGAAPDFVFKLIEDMGSAGDGLLCRFYLAQSPEPVPAMCGRLGGLVFHMPANALAASDGSHFRFGWRPELVVRNDTKAGQVDHYRAAAVDFGLRLAVKAMKPIGIDVARGNRRQRVPPLLIPGAGDNTSGRFFLDARETLSGDDDRRLIANVVDAGEGGAATGSYIVISEEPYTITKFHSQPLQLRGSQENTQVAIYDSDTRQWQVKQVAKTYHYQFPPQVVGESMDKPRQLELHDLQDESDAQPQRPYVDDQGLKRRAVEFRLAPSAELWIRPSDVARGYFLPEWASYDIFRQRGQYGLGAAMEAFRGEFLYGLTVGIDVNRETGAARGARVAEIER